MYLRRFVVPAAPAADFRALSGTDDGWLAAMTNRVDRLVGRDLMNRETNPQNRRQLLISLTPQGRQLVDDVVAYHVENQRTMLQALNEREQETLARLLRKFLLSQDDRADDERRS